MGRAGAVVDASTRAREAPGEAGNAGTVGVDGGLGGGVADNRGKGELEIEVSVRAVATLDSGSGKLRGADSKDTPTAGAGESRHNTMGTETAGELVMGGSEERGITLTGPDMSEGGTLPDAVSLGVPGTAKGAEVLVIKAREHEGDAAPSGAREEGTKIRESTGGETASTEEVKSSGEVNTASTSKGVAAGQPGKENSTTSISNGGAEELERGAKGGEGGEEGAGPAATRGVPDPTELSSGLGEEAHGTEGTEGGVSGVEAKGTGE